MVAIAASGGRAQLEVGRVVRGTLRGLRRNWPRILALALPLLFAPYFAAHLILHYAPIPRLIEPAWVQSYLVRQCVGAAVNVIPGSVVAAFICRWVAADVSGSRKTFALVNLANLPALLVVRLVSAVAVNLALLLLYLPGLLLSIAWIVTTPIVVFEDERSLKSLARSAEFTRRHRGRIFLIWLVFALINLGMALCVGALIGVMYSGLLGPALGAGFSTLVLYGLSALISSIYVVLWQVAAPVLYFELIRLKSGVSALSVATVFD